MGGAAAVLQSRASPDIIAATWIIINRTASCMEKIAVSVIYCSSTGTGITEPVIVYRSVVS
jgi:hypothetical protein